MKQKEQNTSSTYYGWTIVALAALQIFFSGPGQTYSISNWKYCHQIIVHIINYYY